MNKLTVNTTNAGRDSVTRAEQADDESSSGEIEEGDERR